MEPAPRRRSLERMQAQDGPFQGEVKLVGRLAEDLLQAVRRLSEAHEHLVDEVDVRKLELERSVASAKAELRQLRGQSGRCSCGPIGEGSDSDRQLHVVPSTACRSSNGAIKSSELSRLSGLSGLSDASVILPLGSAPGFDSSKSVSQVNAGPPPQEPPVLGKPKLRFAEDEIDALDKVKIAVDSAKKPKSRGLCFSQDESDALDHGEIAIDNAKKPKSRGLCFSQDESDAFDHVETPSDNTKKPKSRGLRFSQDESDDFDHGETPSDNTKTPTPRKLRSTGEEADDSDKSRKFNRAQSMKTHKGGSGGILSKQSSMNSLGSHESSGGGGFAIHPCWFESRHSVDLGAMDQKTMMRTDSKFFEEDDDDDSDVESESTDQSFTLISRIRRSCSHSLSILVVPPNRPWRVFWDVLASILVGYECIVIPLQFFELDDPFIKTMVWCVRCFWTVDLPLSFFTGYLASDGKAVLDPCLVVKNYLKTWFAVDASMLFIDWAEQLLSSQINGLNAARLGKTVKSLRMIRMLRIWKIIKTIRTNQMPDILRSVVEYFFRSEVSFIVLGVLRILIIVVWLNHVMGCCWYGIGNGASDETDSWVKVHLASEDTVHYRYVTAFHWSLTQFTGTMEVNPNNASERTYAVFMLLFAFVTGAIVVSSITSSMTRLQIARSQESNRFMTLRQFLLDNQISGRVAQRVQRNAQFAMMERKRNIPEGNIELLSMISEPLRVELHFEINMPILGNHPFLRNYAEINPGMMRQICHTATDKMSLSRGDVLFCHGEVSHDPRMYFLVSGRLTYIPQQGTRKTVAPKEWSCEAVLWTPWAHCGAMRAKQESTILALSSEKFQTIATQFHGHVQYAQRYGSAFVQHLNNERENGHFGLTDLEDPEMGVEWIADRTRMAEDAPERQERSKSLMRRASVQMMKKGVTTTFNQGGTGAMQRLGSFLTRHQPFKRNSANEEEGGRLSGGLFGRSQQTPAFGPLAHLGQGPAWATSEESAASSEGSGKEQPTMETSRYSSECSAASEATGDSDRGTTFLPSSPKHPAQSGASAAAKSAGGVALQFGPRKSDEGRGGDRAAAPKIAPGTKVTDIARLATQQ